VSGEWRQIERGRKDKYPAIDLEFLVEGLSLCRDGLPGTCGG
jgi:hypothetical protein